jgi:hypothetical protein
MINDIILKIDCLMALPALFVWLVLLVAATKIHSGKQAIIAGAKHSKQANVADWLTRQIG